MQQQQPGPVVTNRVDAQYEPSTPLREYRRVARGDFGPAVDSRQLYPRQGVYTTLSALVDRIDQLPYCTDASQATTLNDATAAGIIPNDLADALRNVPPGERCLASVKYYSNQLLEQQRQSDRRRVKLPRYGQRPEDYDVTYVALTPLQRAKKHLDKARQMYVSGRSIIALALDNPQDNAARNMSRINRGRALQYSVDDANNQRPRMNSHSALYHLWQAYRYVREYEMNPPPPLNADGTMNRDRVRQDEEYVFIMGTMRLQPNRLGIGDDARDIWRLEGAVDAHYYPNVPAEVVGVEQQDRGVGRATGGQLYANIDPTDEHGPERAQALLAWVAANGAVSSVTQWPTSDTLAALNFPNVAEWPDAARALYDVHTHFVPPRSVPLTLGQETAAVAASRPPAPLAFPPYATPGEPYASSTVIDDNNNEVRAWPFDDIEAPSADYIPVFFPTGESLQPAGVGPPYQNIVPPAINAPNDNSAIVLLGAPDPRQRPERWDARQSAEILASYTGRLQHVGAQHALLQRDVDARVRGAENPAYSTPETPLQYWNKGKAVFDYIRVPGTIYRFALAAGAGEGDQQQQPGVLNPFVAATSATTTTAPGAPLPPQRSTSGRGMGVDRRMYVYQVRPVVRRVVSTPSDAVALQLDTLYPLGVAPLDVPRVTDFSRLPNTRDGQVRMLMHALFLLSAPLNAWMRGNLPERLWLHEPPLDSRDPGSLTYGNSWPGEGYYARTNQNQPDPARKGWRGYVNVFALPPEGGIRGRVFQPVAQEAAAGGRSSTNNTTTNATDNTEAMPRRPDELRTNGVPIGPLALDPQFGLPDHIPGQNYIYTPTQDTMYVWVVRTNQITVMNENTWGLDFYY